MLKIRVLKKEELPLLLKHSYEANLDIEEALLTCQYLSHQNDFFIAHKDDALVGFIVALRHSDEFAFINNFLVLKEFQGHGYGTMLFTFALEHLDGKQIALECSYEMQNFYEKFGFNSYFDLHTFLYITQTPKKQSNFHFETYKNSSANNKTNIYLQCLLKNKDVHYYALQDESIQKSFGILFPYKDGYKVLIESQNYDHAQALFYKLTQRFEEGESIYLDATKLNPIFLTLAKDLEMIEFNRSARMYNKVL